MTQSVIKNIFQLFIVNYIIRVFRENSGISLIVKLTRSKDHTPRVIYAANKVLNNVV